MEETGILKTGTAAVAERYHRGTNQSGMRDYNERLVLSLVRQPRQPVQDRDRAAHQAVGADRLGHHARAGGGRAAAAQRADARQDRPALHPDVARSGRRVLPRPEDRAAQRRAGADRFPRRTCGPCCSMSYRYPTPRETVEFVSDGIKRIRAGLTVAQDGRIAGLGIAMPFELWNWADTAGAPREVMENWRNRDIRADIQAQVQFSGLSAERRDVGLRRRAGVRQRRHATRLHLFLHRRVRRRRHRAQWRALWRADRQCRRARLDAGSRTRRRAAPADRHRLDRHAGKGAQCQRP